MSQWDERIRGHRIWELLNSVGPSIDQALQRDTLTTEDVDSLERLRLVLSFCGKRLASTDPALVPPSVVEVIANLLTALKAYVDTFVNTGDVGQLNSANTQADSLLANIVSILAPVASNDLTILSEAASSYRSTLEKHLKDALTVQQTLTERSRANEERITALEVAITEEKTRLVGLITDQQSQFSAAQDKRASDFSGMQNDQLSKYTTATTEFQTQFSTDQDTRKTTFSEFLRSSSEKVAELIAESNSQLSKYSKEYEEKLENFTENLADKTAELQRNYAHKAELIVNDIEASKARVEKLVGVIGNLGVTSGYQKTANHARSALYVWQSLTVISLVCLIAVAVFTAFPGAGERFFGLNFNNTSSVFVKSQSAAATLNEAKDTGTRTGKTEGTASTSASSFPDPDKSFYHGLATRIFLALTFGIFAGYAGRQASHFMASEKRNRKLALELEALGPFIEPLSEEDRNKFRIQVGERSFGVSDHEGDKHKGDDPVTFFDLMRSKDMRDWFLDLYKKSKSSQNA